MDIPKEKLLALYRDLLTGRRLGEKINDLVGEGHVIWTTGTHRPTGEEVPPIACLHNLKKGDFFRPNFRCNPLFFAQQDGAYSLRDILAQDCNRDVYSVGGHSFYLDPEAGNTGHRVCLGEEPCITLGAALAASIRGTDQVAITIFGDGQANRGPVHEAMVVAAAKKLPIIFGLQNNKYHASTFWKDSYAITDLHERAKAYGFPGVTVDGNDMILCYETVKEYVDRARSGDGPGLIVFDTWRLGGHTVQDAQIYRPKGEAQEWWKFDPLPRYQKQLIEMGLLTEDAINTLNAEITAQVEEAAKAALEVPPRNMDEHDKTAIDQLASWTR